MSKDGEQAEAFADWVKRQPPPRMSLRQYYAGQALVGMLATWPDIVIKEDAGRLVAMVCVEAADALIEELEKTK